jgi:hypothetical protein
MPSVFISHRRVDAVLAEKLAQELKDAGNTVWLDDWEIGIGDSIIEKMHHGLEGASYLVLCFSNYGVMAPWISREWMSALARQMEGENVKILPVVLSGGSAPAIISDLRCANLVDDWKLGVAEILRAIR